MNVILGICFQGGILEDVVVLTLGLREGFSLLGLPRCRIRAKDWGPNYPLGECTDPQSFDIQSPPGKQKKCLVDDASLTM